MLQMKNCVTYRLETFHTHLVHDLTTSDAFVIHYFVVCILTKRVFLRNRVTMHCENFNHQKHHTRLITTLFSILAIKIDFIFSKW